MHPHHHPTSTSLLLAGGQEHRAAWTVFRSRCTLFGLGDSKTLLYRHPLRAAPRTCPRPKTSSRVGTTQEFAVEMKTYFRCSPWVDCTERTGTRCSLPMGNPWARSPLHLDEVSELSWKPLFQATIAAGSNSSEATHSICLKRLTRNAAAAATA